MTSFHFLIPRQDFSKCFANYYFCIQYPIQSIISSFYHREIFFFYLMIKFKLEFPTEIYQYHFSFTLSLMIRNILFSLSKSISRISNMLTIVSTSDQDAYFQFMWDQGYDMYIELEIPKWGIYNRPFLGRVKDSIRFNTIQCLLLSRFSKRSIQSN